MALPLCDEIAQAWCEREGPVVLATVSGDGTPNAIYATIVSRMADGRLAVADNYFVKTKANIDSGSRASVLFMTKQGKAYQVKGRLEYHADGPLHAEMLIWADAKHPRKGVAILNAEEGFAGSKKLM